MCEGRRSFETKGEATELFKTRWVGIDVAKDSMEVFVGPSRRFAVENTSEGLAQLVKELSAIECAHVIFEATGGCEFMLSDALAQAKIKFSRVNPRQARDFAKALNRLAKTDRIDAELLAEFGKRLEPLPTVLPDEASRLLHDLVSRRRQLVDMRSMEQMRLKQARTKRLVQSIERTIAFLSKQIGSLDGDIDMTCKTLPEFKVRDEALRTMKGVGPVTRSTLYALVPELGHLSGKQVAALIGVAPFNDDSGKGQGRRRISGGRGDVREVLYMAAMSARLHDATIRTFYDRLLAAGKIHRVAIVASMRKLLVILNARVRDALRQAPQITAPGT
jgi:transposase